MTLLEVAAWGAFYAASLSFVYRVGYDRGYSAGLDYATMAADMILGE